MQRYNTTSLAFAVEAAEADCHAQIEDYLLSEGGYWLENDIWTVKSGKFEERGIDLEGRKRGSIADFTAVPDGWLKTELKYHALWSLTNKVIMPSTYATNCKSATRDLGNLLQGRAAADSIMQISLSREEAEAEGWAAFHQAAVFRILNGAKSLLSSVYDISAETDRDIWRAIRIPGARLSAAQKRSAPHLRVGDIPEHYKSAVKRYMRRLVVKRSWSHCSEMLRYIRKFFHAFYRNGYADGFLKQVSRFDIERYLEWVAEDYEGGNATYSSKAVSFIREFLDYIQMAEYPEAPERDIYRLIFPDDIPKRERPEDTFEKIKYIPEPVKIQLDANVSAIEPEEMQPLYVLLRESGWRGTDILNLRYDSCIDYVWNKAEEKYVPYLCGEITKTGIPLLKIPIRDDVAELVEELKKEAELRSTGENNPEKYLFNTYEGLSMGLPYSKAAFVCAVQGMIDRKGICGADGKPYHFRAHSLRHTRASEYAEQGVPIGVIQRMLGHCSLQMSLHYAKVSENAVYQKWKETEALGILQIRSTPPGMSEAESSSEKICYEHVRKGLDAVRVPFGVCFKPSRLACRTQLKHCLECASFCSTQENEAEYREEVKRVGAQIALSKRLGRQEWVEKNQEYLNLLLSVLERIREKGVVHKNGALREDPHG